MTGNTIMIILLMPTLFQAVWLGVLQPIRDLEIQQRPTRIQEAVHIESEPKA